MGRFLLFSRMVHLSPCGVMKFRSRSTREFPLRTLVKICLEFIHRVSATIEIPVEKRTVTQAFSRLSIQHCTPDPDTALDTPPAVAVVFSPGWFHPKTRGVRFHQGWSIERNGKHLHESWGPVCIPVIPEQETHNWKKVPVVTGEIQIPEKIPGVERSQQLTEHPCSKDRHQRKKCKQEAVQGPYHPMNSCVTVHHRSE